MNGHNRYDYAMIEFVSNDRTIATCPAIILGFVQYNITLGIPTPQFTGEEELSLNTIKENIAVDNNLSVPCRKGNQWGNTLATRYNHKIILVDDTLTNFPT